MSKERPQGELRNPIMKRLAALRERHRAGAVAAQEYERTHPSDSDPVDLGRRRMLLAGSFGAGATAASLLERRVMGPEIAEDERRAQFNKFVSSINSVTNFESFYPGGFANVTDEELHGLFVVREFYDDRHVRTISQLDLPSLPDNPYNKDRGPALEVANIRSHIGTSKEYSILRITGHFVPTRSDNGLDINLFNLNKGSLPVHSDLTEEEVHAFAAEVITDPLLRDGTWSSDINPSERDENNQAWQFELFAPNGMDVTGLLVENTGETIYQRIQKGSEENR